MDHAREYERTAMCFPLNFETLPFCCGVLLLAVGLMAISRCGHLNRVVGIHAATIEQDETG